jgi:hypothetical protein
MTNANALFNNMLVRTSRSGSESRVLASVRVLNVFAQGRAVRIILDAQLGAKRINARLRQDSRAKSLLVALFEPSHGLISIEMHRLRDSDLIASTRLRNFTKLS